MLDEFYILAQRGRVLLNMDIRRERDLHPSESGTFPGGRCTKE